MTPYARRLAEQAATEVDSAKLNAIVAELCRAIDDETARNQGLRRGCAVDCREHLAS
jgi:hypothetical protein